jgi:polyhydroxyalkanoate synthesis regulator phasin
MDIASIASFLLPTLLSLLFGEGNEENQEKIFPSTKKLPLHSKMAMYGYGYRYPRAPRIAYYEDPNYRFKWVRAAIGNRAVAKNSPWINFLRREGAFEAIGDFLRGLAEQYKVEQGGVKESTKRGARQRITKLQRAIAALEDQALLKNIAEDLGDRYSADYVTDSINRLKKEIAALEATIAWKPPAQTTTGSQVPPQPSAKKISLIKKAAKGYGLTSGLGYDEGYGYGYFY